MPRVETLLTSTPQALSFSDITFDASIDRDHPNKLPFTGTLLLLDEPSQQPPHGAEGHTILVPREAAEKALPSVVGMGINYKPNLEEHDPKKKIGVISKAWIDGNAVKVKGIIWPKDFPEAVARLHANRGDLGMSMELGNVYVEDQDADVWTLEKFHFTGATVLKKESAAYQHTSLAASAVRKATLAAAAAAMGALKGGKGPMANGKHKAKDQNQVLAAAIAAGVETAFNKGVIPKLTKALEDVGKTNGAILTMMKAAGDQNKVILATLTKKESAEDADDGTVDLDVEAILAATHGDATDPTASSSSSSSSSRMAGGADASSSASMSSAAANSSTDDATTDQTDPSASASDQRAAADPTAVDGNDPTVPDNRIVNKKASEHAHKQAKSGAAGQLTPGGGNGGVSASKDKKGVIQVAAATAKLVNDLRAQNEELRGVVGKQNNRIRKMEAQLDRFSERIERRSLSPEVLNLLEKTGHDPRELMAGSAKLSVGQVDEMFEKSGLHLDPTTRMALKNQLVQAGVMDQGIVNRQRLM
jgi:hypothetical protein